MRKEDIEKLLLEKEELEQWIDDNQGYIFIDFIDAETENQYQSVIKRIEEIDAKLAKI